LKSHGVLVAAPAWGHVGAHSGLAPLFREIESKMPGLIQRIDVRQGDANFVTRINTGMRLVLGLPRPVPGWMTINKESPFYNKTSWMIEQTISEMVRKSSPTAVLLGSMDEQLFLLAKEKASWSKTRLIGICHQPPAWWELNHSRQDIVQSLDYMIVLASNVRSYWERFTSGERIIVIPHGVDANVSLQ
jgi:hypothetical protein